MLQDVPPALTRFVPDWLPWAVAAGYGLYRAVKSLRETHQRGKASQRKEREGEIAEAISPLKEQLKEARELADLRREKIEELEKSEREKSDRIAQLENKLGRGKDLADELQQTVFELRGEIAEMSKRLSRYEKGEDPHPAGGS